MHYLSIMSMWNTTIVQKVFLLWKPIVCNCFTFFQFVACYFSQGDDVIVNKLRDYDNVLKENVDVRTQLKSVMLEKDRLQNEVEKVSFLIFPKGLKVMHIMVQVLVVLCALFNAMGLSKRYRSKCCSQTSIKCITY